MLPQFKGVGFLRLFNGHQGSNVVRKSEEMCLLFASLDSLKVGV